MSAVRPADFDTIRRRLRNRREALGMTQRALAAELGTVQSHISELENSDRPVTTAVLQRWTEALGFRLTIEERHQVVIKLTVGDQREETP